MLAIELPVIPEEESVVMHDGVSGQISIEEDLENVGNGEGLRRGTIRPNRLGTREGFDHGFPEMYPENTRPQRLGKPATTTNERKRNVPLPIKQPSLSTRSGRVLNDIVAYTTASVGTAIQPVGSELKGLCYSPFSCSKSADLKATKVTCPYFERKQA